MWDVVSTVGDFSIWRLWSFGFVFRFWLCCYYCGCWLLSEFGHIEVEKIKWWQLFWGKWGFCSGSFTIFTFLSILYTYIYFKKSKRPLTTLSNHGPLAGAALWSLDKKNSENPLNATFSSDRSSLLWRAPAPQQCLRIAVTLLYQP